MTGTGLRERQKASRRKNILMAAHHHFVSGNYGSVTIGDIANDANVSAVTIFNYFGSKAGLLLALVEESDRAMMQELDRCIETSHESLVDGVLAFGEIVREHAATYLGKPIWREIISASINHGGGDFGAKFAELDASLIGKMKSLICGLQAKGIVDPAIDPDALSEALFAIQNMRFCQFIPDDKLPNAEISQTFRRDLESLERAFSA